jgi:hypothetical protein
MKMIIKKPMLLLFFITLSFASCNNEELFIDDVVEVVDDTPIDPDNPPVEDPNSGSTDASAPCDFTLDAVQSGDTVIINCMMDLGGATINLPSNVTIVYEGGDIINGTINFSDSSVISGELLNASLTLSGATPLLKDPVFNFDPTRWGIVEGIVSDEIALSNRDILEGMFLTTKDMGVTTFSIDNLDAYFKVDGYLNEGVPETHAVNIPSDFNLVMSDNTHLRMQPNGHFRASLLAIYNTKNITVTGGYLHGDREEHNYNSNFIDSDGSTGPSYEWVNAMSIKGGENITIKEVTFLDAAGDGLQISSIYHYFDPRNIRSKNIEIFNNKFVRNRRMNLTLTDCEQIYIENNEFIDGGIDMPNSNGVAPSCDFNIEPFRSRDSNGNLIEYQRVSHVYIRNNKQTLSHLESKSMAGGFYFSHGNGPIIFENNEIESIVYFSTVEGVIIRDNILKGGVGAGIASNTNRTDFVFGNEVYNNKITGTVVVAGNGVTVRDNEIEGGDGIYLGAGAKESSLGVSNAVIKDNNIKASGRGIVAINTTSNTIIEGNTIDMLTGSTSALTLYNSWDERDVGTSANFVVRNNTVTGVKGNDTGAPTSVIGASSISIINNSLGAILVSGGKNTIFKNNNVDVELNKSAFEFLADCPNSIFSDNTITLYTSKTPLQIGLVKLASGVQLSSSLLMENNQIIEK